MNIFAFRDAYPALIHSQTATRYGIDNRPDSQEIVDSLENLWVHVICPIAKHFGAQNFMLSSGYRCLKLNRLLKSKDSSQHVKGEAADFEIAGKNNERVFHEIPLIISQYDQLILEFHKPAQGPNSGWIHISYRHGECRKQKFRLPPEPALKEAEGPAHSKTA